MENQKLNWKPQDNEKNENTNGWVKNEELDWKPQDNETDRNNNEDNYKDVNGEGTPNHFQPIEELDLTINEIQNPISNNTDNKITPQTSFSYLGEVSKLQISNHLYQLDFNTSQSILELNNINLTKLNDDCKFDFNPKPNTSLGKIIENIVKISIKKQLKIKECFLYKVPKDHSILNIFNSKSKNTFIYCIQSNNKGGNIILNLSSIGGPSVPIVTSPEGILNIIPGWIPCSISKNTSNKELIFIAGNLD